MSERGDRRKAHFLSALHHIAWYFKITFLGFKIFTKQAHLFLHLPSNEYWSFASKCSVQKIKWWNSELGNIGFNFGPNHQIHCLWCFGSFDFKNAPTVPPPPPPHSALPHKNPDCTYCTKSDYSPLWCNGSTWNIFFEGPHERALITNYMQDQKCSTFFPTTFRISF